MIPRETVEKIFNAARIEEVVGDYVTLKKRGANLIGLCPFHDEKTGSFTVSPSKGIYKCFGCGKSGNAIGFIMEIEQCSYTEALKILAKKYHIEVEDREQTAEEKQRQDDRESMFVVNDFAAKWFEEQLWDSREGQAVGLGYFRERGLRDDVIHKFRLGYSPDRNLLAEAVKKQGFNEKYILNDSQNAPYIGTGVCIKSEDGRLYDRFHSRVIFPFFSQAGKVIGFAGRILKHNDKVGKYVNSPTSPLFEKHNELYGLYQAKQAIARMNRCYLVEGQMDVISMHQAGIENVVASGGTSLTQPQIKLIHRFTSNITVLYDGDKAGIKAALRGIDMILQEGIHIKVVLLPEGEDPDSYARSHNASDFIDYIERNQTDFIRFKTRLLSEEAGNDPNQRSELIKSVVQSIAVIPDAITRQVYIKDCSDLLSMQEIILNREVAKLRREKPLDPVVSTPKPALMEETPRIMQKEDTLRQNMLNLLQLIIRYGEHLLPLDQSEQIPVGLYIIECLKEDDIYPTDPLHQRICDEFLAHYQDVGFAAEPFFLHHPDMEISQLAVTLVAEPYQLSKIFLKKTISENVTQEIQPTTDLDVLPELCWRLLLEIKLTTVNKQLDELNNILAKAQADDDWELIRTLLAKQPQLMAIRSELCKALGNRVITL